jgi:hypothetical protein
MNRLRYFYLFLVLTTLLAFISGCNQNSSENIKPPSPTPQQTAKSPALPSPAPTSAKSTDSPEAGAKEGSEQNKTKYEVAGIDDAAALEKFVVELQGYLSKDDKDKIASLVSYPIKVRLDGKTAKTIKDKQEFINNYDKVFYPEYKAAMISAPNKDLFARDQGVMMEPKEAGVGGNLWISPADLNSKELRIVAINNDR